MSNKPLTEAEAAEYVARKRGDKTTRHDNYNNQDNTFPGYGVLDCQICGLPYRDHKIGPCPFADGPIKVDATLRRGGRMGE